MSKNLKGNFDSLRIEGIYNNNLIGEKKMERMIMDLRMIDDMMKYPTEEQLEQEFKDMEERE
jgi:hypothetical protein